MTPDLIAIIAVGVALAVLILRQGARLEKRFDKLIGRFDELIGRFDKLIGRFKSLEDRMAQVVEKQHAMLEGPLEGRREAATCNRVA